MPEVRLGEVVVVEWWCVVRVWWVDGEEERRREKREGLRAGWVVTGGGVGERLEKSGILMLLGLVSCGEEGIGQIGRIDV